MTKPPDLPKSHLAPAPVVQHIVTVVEEGQELTAEQRARTAAWLEANGIDPRLVARDEITVRYKTYGSKPGRKLIGFHQFYEEDGVRVFDWATNAALTFQRSVEQTVELAPDPAWEGWDRYYAERDEQLARVGKEGT